MKTFVNLIEQFSLLREDATNGFTVDKDHGVIRNVMLAKRFSRNNRDYAPVLGKVAELSEGLNVYMNHSTMQEDSQYLGNRDMGNFLGTIKGVRKGADGIIRGDFWVQPSMQKDIFWLAEHKPKDIGLSMDVPFGKYTCEKGKGEGGRDKISSLEEIREFDLVSNAGMAASLFESVVDNPITKDGEEEMEKDARVTTTDGLREMYPSLVEKIVDPLQSRLDKIEMENKTLKEVSQRRSELLNNLQEAKIDMTTSLAQLIDSLSTIENADARKSLLESHLSDAKKVKELESKLRENKHAVPYSVGGNDSEENLSADSKAAEKVYQKLGI